jgi:ribonuclease R
LGEFHIDGLVHITSLDNDYFRYDEVKQYLIGENSGVVYRLGDPVEVKVASVNLDERKIDFLLDGAHGKAIKRSANRKPSRRKKTAGGGKTLTASDKATAQTQDKSASGDQKPSTKKTGTKKPSGRKPRASSSKTKTKGSRSKPATSSRKRNK